MDNRSSSSSGPKDDLRTGNLSRREFVAAVSVGALAAVTLPHRVAYAQQASGPIYRIHPAIGIARVGNADPDTYYLGPEVPGQVPPGPFKDANGLVRPQAARFRIWEYCYVNGVLTPLREVNLSTAGVTKIAWRAHLANRKSAFFQEDGPTGETLPADPLRNPGVADRTTLQSDFGPRTIAGASQGPVEFRPGGSGGTYPEMVVKGPDGVTPLVNYLGQIRTDDQGRLVVLGAKGFSGSNLSPAPGLSHWSNNNNWFDDIADGPVSAVVTVNGQDVPTDRAGNGWVLVAPPRFAPGIRSAISLFDVLYDMGVRSLPVPANNALYQPGGPLSRLAQLHALWQLWIANPSAAFEFGPFQPDFESEIWPILRNAVNYVYVTGLVNFKHASMLDPTLGDPSPTAAKARSGVFTYVRSPQDAANNNTGPATMPRLYGDNWYMGNQNFSFTFAQNGNGNPGGGGVSFPSSGHIPKYQRYATLTPTQYGLMREWSGGNFVSAASPLPPPAASPFDLDRAALENCIGGPFYPGIEAGWQIRNPKLFIEPFRIKFDPANPANCATSQYLDQNGNPEGTPITAGHFSRQMAIPWQADFNDCSKLLNLGWWPSQRPDDVFLNASDSLSQRVPWTRPTTTWSGSNSNANAASSRDDMQANWWKFGFVIETAGGYIESERAAQIP